MITKFTTYIIWSLITQKVIGVDRNSGGYPFETEDIQSMEMFKTREKADEYFNIAFKGSANHEIREMEVRIK